MADKPGEPTRKLSTPFRTVQNYAADSLRNNFIPARHWSTSKKRESKQEITVSCNNVLIHLQKYLPQKSLFHISSGESSNLTSVYC